MPARNTLTRLRLALIRYAVFEAWRNSVRGASVFCLNYRSKLSGTRSPTSMSIMD